MDELAAGVTARNLHDRDFYSWTQEQAQLVRSGRLGDVDLQNVAEELETLGRAEYSALRSSYRLIASHLLKLVHQPSRASRSWRSTIVRERNNVEDCLRDNPGLRPKRTTMREEAYAAARREASEETGLPLMNFPASYPLTLEQLEDHTFWPVQ